MLLNIRSINSKWSLILLPLMAFIIMILIALPNSKNNVGFSRRSEGSIPITIIDEFREYDPSIVASLPAQIPGAPFIELLPFGWRVNTNYRVGSNNVIDEISFTERNLNFTSGRTRKVKLLSLPISVDGVFSNKGTYFHIDNRAANLYGVPYKGRFDLNSAASSAGAFELLYDNNGAGLGLNLSKATNLNLVWGNDHLAAYKNSVLALTLTDSNARSFTKTFTYTVLQRLNRVETIPFVLSEFGAQINLSNISSIKLYVEGGWGQDTTILSLRVDTNPYRITGNAKIRGTSIPVKGAEVSATVGTTVVPGTTGNDGNYLIPDITDGSYSMSISKPGYVLVGTNFVNPVVINGQNRDNVNFEFDCAPGYSLQGQECLPGMTIDASDGTFFPYVLVKWFNQPPSSTCELSRKLSSGGSYQVIATGLQGSPYEDTSSVQGTRYIYQVRCGGKISDENEGYRVPSTNTCPEGTDCIDSELEPTACASANGFLNQINIASVINRGNIDLNVRVEYRDLEGIVKGSTSTRLIPFQKMDFIVNDLGLVKDTYGTACVITDAKTNGAWGGGLTLYKSDARKTSGQFGDAFDFVLYYPYRNPQVGSFTQPLNTNHFGVRADGTVANWIRITDAEKGDGERLRGVLVYTDASGKVIFQDIVNIPDGGRFDYAGHEAIGTFKNLDNIGMVKFLPSSKSDGSASKYYMSTGRYFYDCIGASCGNFYTAFLVPRRPSTDVMTSGGISTVDGEIGIIEINNNSESVSSTVDIKSYSQGAGAVSNLRPIIPVNGTTHVTINRRNPGSTEGLLENDSVGGANLDAITGAVAATSVFYKLDAKGVLEYAYAAPFTGITKTVQFSEFNSFIGNTNVSELFNSTDKEISVQLQARDASNKLVLTQTVIVRPFSTERVSLSNLPKDTYGTILAQSSAQGLSFRNYVRRPDYVVSFRGE